MAITEEARYGLFKALEEALGRDEASTLMEHLPPVGWADVATRHDVEREFAVFRAEMDARFAHVDGRFAEVDGRFAQIEGRFAQIDGRFAQIDGRFEVLDGRIGQLGDQLRAEFRLDTRNLVFAMLASQTTFAAVIIAAIRF